MAARKHRSYGGRTDKKAENVYNAAGSPAMDSAMKQKDDGFKRGGAKKRKDGGSVDGDAAKMRMDRRRGGATKRAAGGQVMSSASKTRGPVDLKDAGHEGERAPSEP